MEISSLRVESTLVNLLPSGVSLRDRRNQIQISSPRKDTELADGIYRISVSIHSHHLADQFKRTTEFKKPEVPKKADKPIMGLVSDKNFIVANAVENILAAPKMPDNKDQDYLKKKTYGKVPKYLNKIKREIEDEYQLVQDLHREEEAQADQAQFMLPEEERQELIDGLKKKWEVVHKEYQTLTHLGSEASRGKKVKKEKCEAELAQIEKDIEKLQKQYIFVDTYY